MTWLYPYLHAKSGVTPPYARSPQGSSWPFYTDSNLTERGGAGGSRMPVPYKQGMLTPSAGFQPPVPTQPAGLPAPMGGGGGLPATQETPSSAIDLLRRNLIGNLPQGSEGGLMAKLASLGSLLRGGPLGAIASVMQPTPAGSASDNGQGSLLQQPTFPQGVPMPQARPPVEDMGNPYAGGMGGAPRPPMSLAPPLPGASANASAPAPQPSFYNGPGSMGFGSSDAAPGASGGQPQTDLLQMLMNRLKSSPTIMGGSF